MFSANAVVKAAQILLEEEEEDDSSENVITRRIRINRDREGAHEKLVNDYFSDAPLYNADIFKRRFQMSRRLFTRIADDLAGLDPFSCNDPMLGIMKGSPRYKSVLRPFAKCKQYLRKPNAYDVQQLYQAHEARHGFPGMLGSIDCMHWAWHNCPTVWRGQYTRGDHGHPTLILEAVASQDLWIWHSFFGLPGSLNDLNVLYQSTIFSDVVNGIGPDTRFTVSGIEYRRGYYLADGIYPSWATIVKTISFPEDEKRKKFAKHQEAARKDIERCFDEGQAICEYDENASYGNTVPVDPTQQDLNSFALTNDYTHANLQHDLVEHIWNNVNVEDGDGEGDEDQ
ncbi:uncharacterized protein LOC110867222 [Helianthus annuus]|uniref:uncharacterized protein LOC110867222 n=1 Tax=Helianthus annuus TaxID=4232 RepID=UPI000B8FB14D|nr:uncharacterized protein LOC110867222 [Helianthus annuus]